MILKGKKVILRPVEYEDIEFIRGLINDPWMEERIVGWALPLSRKDQENWYASYRNTTEQIRYIIETTEEGVVGLCGLKSIDYKNGVATSAGIRITKDVQSRGIATDAYMTLFKYAFSELRLHRINTSAMEENTPSLRVMEKVGCKREGLMRDAIYKNGYYHNIVTLGILDSDYIKIAKDKGYLDDVQTHTII